MINTFKTIKIVYARLTHSDCMILQRNLHWELILHRKVLVHVYYKKTNQSHLTARALPRVNRIIPILNVSVWQLFLVLKHFKQYFFCRPVSIRSDHHPLEVIFTKTITQASLRLQRMLLRISTYDVKIMYIKVKQIKIADCVSQLIKHSKDSEIEGLNLVVHNIRHMISPQKKTSRVTATSNDTTMLKLTEYIQHGWPSHRADCKNLTEQYFSYRDELSVYSDLV